MRDSKPEFNISKNPNAKIAIVVAQWNSDYNEEMFNAARTALIETGIAESNIERFESPGAFEIPLLSMKLAETKKYDAIICFATVIRGNTRHFAIVADESSRGIMDVMLKTGVPILNGILACENTEQAEYRASQQKENKGKEVALSALALLNELTAPSPLN